MLREWAHVKPRREGGNRGLECANLAGMRKLLVLVLPVATLLGACSSCRKEEPSGGAGSALTAVPPGAFDAGAAKAAGEADGGRAAQRRRMFPGVVGMFVAAAREQARDEAQSAKIDEITKPLAEDDPTRRTEENELRADVLAAVKSGQADAAKIGARYAAVEKSAAARSDAEATALTSLHALLDPAQRKAVATDVKTKVATRLENAKGREGDKGKPPTDDRSSKRAERLEKDLGLDAEQKKKLATITAANERKSSPGDVWKRQLAIAEAFEKDGFDAKKVEGGGFAGKTTPPQLVDDARFYVALAPSLKPEQREKLAAVMEGRGGRGGRGGWGRRGPGGRGGHDHDHGHGGLPGLPGGPGGPGGPPAGPAQPDDDDE